MPFLQEEQVAGHVHFGISPPNSKSKTNSRAQNVRSGMLVDLRESVRHLKEFSRTMADQPESVIRGNTPQGRK